MNTHAKPSLQGICESYGRNLNELYGQGLAEMGAILVQDMAAKGVSMAATLYS